MRRQLSNLESFPGWKFITEGLTLAASWDDLMEEEEELIQKERNVPEA